MPIELIIVVGGTIVARLLAMESRWEIKSVGHIPTGLPDLVVPEFSMMRDLMVDAFTIAMVSYTVSVSMALIFGQKFNYEIDFNQELLAMVIQYILIINEIIDVYLYSRVPEMYLDHSSLACR